MDTPSPRVLVVDDEDAVRELLVYGLKRQGFDVRGAADGATALSVLQSWTPSAIVLDVMLPGTDGLAMLPAFRRISEVPIIMLTALSETAERLAALTIGADDFLSKPFEMEELVARLRAALRRPRLHKRETIAYGDLSIDVGKRTVAREDGPIALVDREFDVLLTLAREPERVFSRTELLDLVWGTSGDTAPATVETYMADLRSKIDRRGKARLIHVTPDGGYALRRTAP